jgi:hypothetical protein
MKLLLSIVPLMLACRAMGFAFAPAGVARRSFSTVGALHKAQNSARPAFRSTRLTIKCSWGAEVVWQPVRIPEMRFCVLNPETCFMLTFVYCLLDACA